MATQNLIEVPARRGKASAQFSIHEGSSGDEHDDTSKAAHGVLTNGSFKPAMGENPTPLTTSKRGNQSSQAGNGPTIVKKQKSEHVDGTENKAAEKQPLDQLLEKLVEQQSLLKRQQRALTSQEDEAVVAVKEYDRSSNGSKPVTPGTESFGHASVPEACKTDAVSAKPDENEVLRLKQELLAAQSKIARMDQELSQTRITKHTLDQALGPPSEVDFPIRGEVTEQTITSLQSALNASMRPPLGRGDSWVVREDSHSDSSEGLSAAGYNRSGRIWNDPAKIGINNALPSPTEPQFTASPMNWTPEPTRPWFTRVGTAQDLGPQYQHPQPHRPMTGQQMHGLNEGGRFGNDLSSFPTNGSLRHNQAGRLGTAYGTRNNGFGGFPPTSGPSDTIGSQTSSSYPPTPVYPGPIGYQPRPIGTPLSPTAPEFNTSHGTSNNPWNASAPASPGQTYVSPVEPLNYRRLLDRTVNCNWKYIVDKIVCNNDQQASIFLQQKLKIGTSEQKYEIVEAIVAQAYPLMVNRFGNFLVQRCFEHGAPEQVVAIANAIRGNTLNLSMDAFGCHVVQKAFDSVPEEYKAIMVHELLRRIPETVIHRYACHVWQKLFELRWNDSPPQIMKYVNEALRGMWHEVALGETGSLVVQNIFENCLEEDKRPCINEVLGSIDIVAHGQFGNWCIQHICEHGAPGDRSRAIDHVVRFATEYSMDQFASKVVEKCLKIGGTEFLERYLDRVCEGRSDRPRIPLIDIASDQYGNYLVQYILTHSGPQHREVVASHIRKHMVSLRGSKFGSRVGMLCCNPAVSTRPGPGAGPAMGRFNNPRFGGAYR